MNKKIGVIFTICLVILVAYVAALSFSNDTRKDQGIVQNESAQQPGQNENNTLVDPSFQWSYQEFEESEIPRTTITLTARSSDGVSQTKEIDTIEGGCNEYAEPDVDAYSTSTMIICYYAGLGRYYKVVEQDGTYLVQRKIFEEASPDYVPVQNEFETIASF
jgi:hypothetical protein